MISQNKEQATQGLENRKEGLGLSPEGTGSHRRALLKMMKYSKCSEKYRK